MISTDLVRLGTQSATAFLLFEGTAHVWELAVLQGIAGAAAGLFNPASTALIPQTVSAGRLQQANALISISRSTTTIFGPAVLGGDRRRRGPRLGVRHRRRELPLQRDLRRLDARRGAVREPAAQRFWRDLADGWREVRRHRWLTAGFLGYAVGNFGRRPVHRDRDHSSPSSISAAPGLGPDRRLCRVRRRARRLHRLPDPAEPSGGHGLCDLDALRAAAVRAGAAVPAPGR